VFANTAKASLRTISIYVLSVIPDPKSTEAELLEKASKERAEIVARYARVSSLLYTFTCANSRSLPRQKYVHQSY